jgi:hypothetical protein
MIQTGEFLTRVQRKLDDEAEEIWTRDFLLGQAQDGYDKLCREAECLFDMQMYDDQPLGGNYTRDFEVEYMTGPILGRFNYTRESEREYVTDGALGPVNHTRPSDATVMVETDHPPTSRTLANLGNRLVSVDRVTHDWLRLLPEHDRYFRMTRTDYQTRQGGVYSYSMDQDGVFNLRTVGIPVRTLPAETISGVFGGVRQISSYGFDSEPVIGTYGGIRSTPRHFVTGDAYGGVRRIVPDDRATRVELFRLGKPLTEHGFEIPDRFVRFVEWWTMYAAYSEPGLGENEELASHFKQRFEYGIGVVKRRVNAIQRERTIAMGQKRTTKRDNYLEMFPANYGYKRPYGR